ncbi:hypothetical protein ABPG72_013534 [Tetrahymena utriculariae]
MNQFLNNKKFKFSPQPSNKNPFLSYQEITQREQYIYSINQYEIYLNLNIDFYTGNVKININFREEVLKAIFDEIFIIDYCGEKIVSVGIQLNDGQEEQIHFQYVPNKLSVPLKDIQKHLNKNKNKKDNNLTLIIAFQNEYSKIRAEGIVKYCEEKQNRHYIYCQGEVGCTQMIFPCIDMVNFRSYYTLTVQHPAGWMVSSQADWYKQEKITDEIAISYFPQTNIAFPTYLFGLYAGDYFKYTDKYRDEIDINIYCRQNQIQFLDEDVNEYFRQIKFALDFMESYTGVKYFFQKFDLFFCPYYKDIGMETFGCISLDENYYLCDVINDEIEQKNILNDTIKRYVFDLDRVETLFHEIAHQWFGNYVSIKWWNDLFFKEGFANLFSQKMLYQYFKNENGIELRSSLDQFDFLQDDLKKNQTLIHAPLEYEKYLELSTHDDITYMKSQNIFDLLENKIYGQEKFKNILQKLLQDFKSQSISNKDLLAYFDDLVTKKLLTTKGHVYFVGQNLLQAKSQGSLNLSKQELDVFDLKIFVVERETNKLAHQSLQELKKQEQHMFLYILNTVDHHMVYQQLDIEALKYIDQEKLMDKFDYKLRASIWKAIIYLCDNDEWVPYLNKFFIKNLQYEKDDTVLQVILEYYIKFCDEFSDQDEEELLKVIGLEQSDNRLQIFLYNCGLSYFENLQNLQILQIEYFSQIETLGQQFLKKMLNKIEFKKIDNENSSESSEQLCVD